jgi:MinD-like ATPase involved in chromosome partitioning or flagellar assembly
MTQDQAAKLRLLIHDRHETAGESPRAANSVVVYGAKGGVGATTVALNLAIALSAAGCEVELAPRDQLDARSHSGPAGIALRGESHWRRHLSLRQAERDVAFDAERDWLVVDGGAWDAVYEPADLKHALVIASPEPVAVLAAYDALKELLAFGYRPAVLFNRVADEPQARGMAERLRETARRMLGQTLETHWLAEDGAVLAASLAGAPVVLAHPGAMFSRQLHQFAERWLATRSAQAA